MQLSQVTTSVRQPFSHGISNFAFRKNKSKSVPTFRSVVWQLKLGISVKKVNMGYPLNICQFISSEITHAMEKVN